MDPLSLLWLFFILASLQPAVQRQMMLLHRRRALTILSRKRQGTVITLIHRQESMSLLGFPIVRYIDIDDAESVLRAINETPAGRSIEIVLHTPGGMVIAARQIATALADHDGHVTAVVPHYAMSGGTMIALAADEIVVDAHASLGPVDPQLGQYPAASLVAVSERPGDHDDQTLLMADVGRKAIAQVEGFTERLLGRYMPAGRAAEKVGRLKLNGRLTGRSPLSPFVELEAVEVGVCGKLLLWQVLRDRRPPGAGVVDLDELIRRAQRQLDEVERHRRDAADALGA